MINEPNHFSRNLKVISVLFILYWLFGLELADYNFKTPFLSFNIKNPDYLPYVSHIFLLYFAWRYYISKESIGFHKYRGYALSFVCADNIRLTNQYYFGKNIVQKLIAFYAIKSFRKKVKHAIDEKVKDSNWSVVPGYEQYIKIDKDYQQGIFASGSLAFYVHKGPQGRLISTNESWKYFRLDLPYFITPICHLIIISCFMVKDESASENFAPWLLFAFALFTSLCRYFNYPLFGI
jgi:hypothetical protein